MNQLQLFKILFLFLLLDLFIIVVPVSADLYVSADKNEVLLMSNAIIDHIEEHSLGIIPNEKRGVAFLAT